MVGEWSVTGPRRVRDWSVVGELFTAPAPRYRRGDMSYADLPTRRAEIESRVVRRAWADADFLAWLRSDPRAALADELGVSLPRRLEIMVVEEKPDLLCIVIPVDLSGIDERASRSATGIAPRLGARDEATGAAGL
jgi:hypothetical protein